MERVTLTIDGMSCGHCVRAVREALGELPGVQVDELTVGLASVAYDPTVSSVETVTRAVANAGYSAHPVAR